MVRLRHNRLLGAMRRTVRHSGAPQPVATPPSVGALLWAQRAVALALLTMGVLSGRAALAEGLLLGAATLLARNSFALYTQAMAALTLIAAVQLALFAVRAPRRRDGGWQRWFAACRAALLVINGLAARALVTHRNEVAGAQRRVLQEKMKAASNMSV
jgi:hypothetical protein